MNHSRNGARCHCEEHCLLVQEMKTIPASFLPEGIRTGLSMILDPSCELPDNDYKFFASRNNVTPKDVRWLDSQKTQFNPSSIKAVLDYLSRRDGDRFTVFQVYKTLCEMNSDGQRIVLDGMPDIRRLYRENTRGTRPGQQHTEPPSLNVAAQPIPLSPRFRDSPPQCRGRSPSPPPPYESAALPQSNYMDGGEVAFFMNDLNAGGSPRNGPDVHRYGGQSNRSYPPTKQDRFEPRMGRVISQQSNVPSSTRPGIERSFSSDNDREFNGSYHQCSRFASGENSFYPIGYSERRDFCDGRQAAENSCFSNGSDCANLPSYTESQSQHSRRSHQHGMYRPSSTRMQELKVPLEGPEVNPGSFSGQWSLQAGSQVHGRQVPLFQVSPRNMPANFPDPPLSSWSPPHGSAGPVCDPALCSCSEADRGASMFIPPSVLCSNTSDSLPSCVHWDYNGVSSLNGSDAVSGVSAEGCPWNDRRHQTEVKEPLEGRHEQNSALQCTPVIVNINTRSSASLPQLSLSNRSSSENGLASRFVLVVAADMEETDRLDQQVSALCQQLQARGIHYVVVRSTSQRPLLGLTQRMLGRLPPLNADFYSVQHFVWSCFKKASKVLMVITPGYLRYADAYSVGAEREATTQQKLMRKIQEKLKEEFFDRKRPFRIWPVILHEMNANRVHIPSFLSSSAFYWFPCMEGGENVSEILRQDFISRQSRGNPNSSHSSLTTDMSSFITS